MKKLLLSVLLATTSLGASVDEVTVTTKLPENRLIHPMPKPDPSLFTVKGTFEGMRELTAYSEGTYRTAVLLVTYRLSEPHQDFPNDLLTFIAQKTSIAKGSQRKMKGFPWPFVSGNKSFQLRKDPSCDFKTFYNIVSYTD